MKCSLQQHAWLKSGIFLLACIALLFCFTGCHKGNFYPPKATITTVATGLQGPMGMEIDRAGNIWLAETGTGNNDGKVLIIKPNGVKYDAIINLSSMPNALSGELEGPAHLLLDKGWLYILAADYLYRVNVASFKPGDKALDGSKLDFEDVGTAIRDLQIVDPNDSHPYNLTKGPDGDLYIVDAGANAVIHRKSAGNYSVLAMLPNLPNPTGIGGPTEQAVPTGIIYDGHDFLVSTLTGFPFPADQAVIYKVSLAGKNNVSIYKGGFTTLVDIAQGNSYGHVVLGHGSFAFAPPPPNFLPNTGSLILVTRDSSIVLTGGLNIPSALAQINDHSWYITSLGDGTILKVNYQ